MFPDRLRLAGFLDQLVGPDDQRACHPRPAEGANPASWPVAGAPAPTACGNNLARELEGAGQALPRRGTPHQQTTAAATTTRDDEDNAHSHTTHPVDSLMTLPP